MSTGTKPDTKGVAQLNPCWRTTRDCAGWRCSCLPVLVWRTMKYAIDETGSRVRAAAGAPERALCPSCGAWMILRQRQRSERPGDVTYFWRHQDNANLDCAARSSVLNGAGSHGRLPMG
jgi:hypothetical protein